ncbi:hypothetical protein L4D10_19495 [Vibrio atlanticus]
MNKSLLMLLTMTALLATRVTAAPNKHEVMNQIKAQVSSWIDIQVTPQNSIIQKMVFNCNFYLTTQALSLQMATKAALVHIAFIHIMG